MLGDGGRCRLVDTEDDHVLGVCAAVDGLFREPERGMYELCGWVPEGAEVRGWLGRRVWLVPDDQGVDAWLLEDAEAASGDLVVTGLDDYMGPPAGHRGRVRVHDGRRWLGSCTEFARVLLPERATSPLVLRGLAPSERLAAALAKGTRRALDLDEVALEIRDDRGDLLTEWFLAAKVASWGPSTQGRELVDLELDRALYAPIPEYARPIWERWFAGPPDVSNAWAGLDTRRRQVWLDAVRNRGCRRVQRDRMADRSYELDGRHVTDEPGLYLALGEAVNGPGGYFGACLNAVHDCLRGGFGYTGPGLLVWRDADVARAHLSEAISRNGKKFDMFAEVLEVLDEGGMRVSLRD